MKKAEGGGVSAVADKSVAKTARCSAFDRASFKFISTDAQKPLSSPETKTKIIGTGRHTDDLVITPK